MSKWRMETCDFKWTLTEYSLDHLKLTRCVTSLSTQDFEWHHTLRKRKSPIEHKCIFDDTSAKDLTIFLRKINQNSHCNIYFRVPYSGYYLVNCVSHDVCPFTPSGKITRTKEKGWCPSVKSGWESCQATQKMRKKSVWAHQCYTVLFRTSFWKVSMHSYGCVFSL